MCTIIILLLILWILLFLDFFLLNHLNYYCFCWVPGCKYAAKKQNFLTLRTPTKIQVVQIKSIESRILPRRVLRQDCRKEERRFIPVTPYLELFVFFFRITDATIKHRPLLVSTRTDHPKWTRCASTFSQFSLCVYLSQRT